MAIRVNDNFTFIHIPKCAGLSITQWLELNHPTDSTPHPHNTYEQLPTQWQDNTVAVVRNPWDRLLSLYEHHRRSLRSNNDPFKLLHILDEGFESYVMEHSETVFTYKKKKLHDTNKCWAKTTQHRFVDASTHILRFENLNNDWATFLKKFHITPIQPLPHINAKVDRISYFEKYTKEMAQKVHDIWYEDIERFGYTFSYDK